MPLGGGDQLLDAMLPEVKHHRFLARLFLKIRKSQVSSWLIACFGD